MPARIPLTLRAVDGLTTTRSTVNLCSLSRPTIILMNRFDKLLARLLQKADPDLPDEKISEAVNAAAQAAGEILADELRRRQASMLIDHESLRAAFEVRIRDPWGPALDALYTHQVVAVESAEEHVNETGAEAVARLDVVWSALVQLHARACHMTDEVHAMLRTGHAEAALARWRTIHEVTVIAAFLSEHDSEVARRYLEHQGIIDYWDAIPCQKHAKRLGMEPYGEDELKALTAERKVLLGRYGKEYDGAWGWLAGTIKEPLTFSHLEDETELDHWRPLYRDANAALHGGSQRLTRRLGTIDPQETPLVGASNLGLDQPGIYTALSLTILTTTLLSYKPNMDSLVSARVVMAMGDDAQSAFAEAAELVDQRVAEELAEESRREKRRERDQARRAARRAGGVADQ